MNPHVVVQNNQQVADGRRRVATGSVHKESGSSGKNILDRSDSCSGAIRNAVSVLTSQVATTVPKHGQIVFVYSGEFLV